MQRLKATLASSVSTVLLSQHVIHIHADPLLRPPVDPRELEVDHRTGMKVCRTDTILNPLANYPCHSQNYMATEDGGWDTSTLYIRRSLRTAIELGRRSGLEDGPETNEAFRLMGQALHTLEDLLAHSNWCEVGLRLLGFQDVFCHVGDQGPPAHVFII